MSADILDRVYDAYAGELGQHFMRETQRRIHWVCAAAEGDSVLDVGCSQGLVPILLGREGKSVVGIDSNAEAIRNAEQRLADEGLGVRKRVVFVEGDFALHSFGGQSFDCLILGEVLEHLVNPERFVAAAARQLGVGGRLVVTVPFGINDHFDHKHTFYLLEPYALLHEHFDVVEVSLLGKWLGLVGIRRAEGVAASPLNWSNDDLMRLEGAFNRIERDLVDDAVSLKGRLEDANLKYRASTEEVARLKREVSHHEGERKNAERRNNQLEAQLAARVEPTSNQAPQSELEQERRLRHEHEVMLARLEERLGHSTVVLNFELQARENEIARLNEARAELNSQVQELERRLVRQSEEAARNVAIQQDERARLMARNQELLEVISVNQDRVMQLETELSAQAQSHSKERSHLREELSGKHRRVIELEEELKELQSRSLFQDERLTKLDRELSVTQRALQEHAAAKEELRTACDHAEQEAKGQRERLNVAERTAREQQRDFERVLETQRSLLRATESKMEQTKAELGAARRDARRAVAQLDAERRERTNAERRIIQTRNTLSFQLGYELIHGFKSRAGLVALPKSLWHLQQEAARRRRERKDKHGVPTRSVSFDGGVTMRPPVRSAETPANPPAAEPAPPLTAEAAPLAPVDLLQTRVACIHDEFTYLSFAPECILQQLTPGNWRAELEAFQPQLLFIESAWRGKNDLWSRKVAHRSQELTSMIEWCRARSVPTAFWNKEDPVHYRTFLNTAKLFDAVFTTDIDCVHRYKRALGHDRVYLLPFAVQPRAHNPLEKYERRDAVAFAGAYYARYPERQADLANFVEHFSHSPRLEIFDRNHGKTDPDYQFPERYRPYIVGTLAFEEIDRAYKGYRYALNLNSIKASQSMFARRVFELLGSNTITVSNFSRGLRLLFGDLVVTTDRGERALARLQALAADETRGRRLRLAGLRKVLAEHTYAHRLRFLASKMWDRSLPSDMPHICMVARVHDAREAAVAVATFKRQSYGPKSLLLVGVHDVDLSPYAAESSVTYLPKDVAQRTNLQQTGIDRASHVAFVLERDYYGANYLLDLALATRYSSATVIGKVARYRVTSASGPQLVNDGAQYKSARNVLVRCALIRRDALPSAITTAWLDGLETQVLEGMECLATDEFNYCEDGAILHAAQLIEVEDLADVDLGLSLDTLLQAASAPHRSPVAPEQGQHLIDAGRLTNLFKPGLGKPITITQEGQHMVVQSSLPDETHQYLYAREAWEPSALGLPASGKLHFEATPGLNLQLGVMFLDDKKQRVGHKLSPPGVNDTLVAPEKTAYVQLALRIYGAGSTRVSGLLLEHVPDAPDVLFGRSEYLLITNRYPSDNDLYRNAFVHRRVLEYAKQGCKVDVFRSGSGDKLDYYEFDGVDVVSGGPRALEALLKSNHYRTVLVHFLDARIWETLLPWLSKMRLLIWAHGAEIQAWHRRQVHYGTDASLATAKADSAPRRAFWRNVLQELPAGSKVIFVSRHFAEEVLIDLDLRLPRDRYEIIHNVIDTRLFAHQQKPVEQRKRILSIRPYTSRIYGNDLAVAAILALAERPFFSDLDFHLIGDGPLFEETTAPLRGLVNVRIDRRFLTQQEIAELHRHYGVFLCPSRGDTQGVSRDEAMSSGLVPITNSVGAIPEFVDEESGIVVDPEDALGLAAAMMRLYEDPDLFLRLSTQAARRVRQQSGPSQTTARELVLIRGSEAQ